MDGLTSGRIVHFVMDNGEHRPAIVVSVHNKETGLVNLQVFTDCANDSFGMEPLPSVIWVTTIPYDENAGFTTWHWIEKA